jgi:hypothetical protein
VLYAAALPGLTTLATVVLEESVLFRVPVSVSMASQFADPAAEPRETYSLLIPLLGVLVSGIFTLLIAGYLIWRILKRPDVNRPLLFAIVGISIGLGGWFWL